MTQSNANSFNINNLGGASELQAIMMGVMGSINTGELVKVLSIEEGFGPVGFCSVVPLTYKLDGDNTKVTRGIIHNVPFFRLQGGRSAFIVDPQVGDIGFCGICSRDISMVKRIRSFAAPNMQRNSDIADAVYMGGFLNGTPQQYVQLWSDGIVIKTPNTINVYAERMDIEAKVVNINASEGVTINGLSIAGNGTLTLANGIVMDTHIHTQGNDSGGNTEQPVSPPLNG